MSQNDTDTEMSTVGRIVQDALRASAAQDETAPPATTLEPGTALVALKREPDPEERKLPPRRTTATFLAQLIATERQMPQTRERRRAEPAEALAAYGAAAKLSKQK